MRPTLAFTSVLTAVSFAATGSIATRSSPDRAAINDNRTPAGTLRGGVLTLDLEAREAEWHPDGEAAPGLVVRAFAERGKGASIPGPLIRVPEGTEVHWRRWRCGCGAEHEQRDRGGVGGGVRAVPARALLLMAELRDEERCKRVDMGRGQTRADSLPERLKV